MANFAKSCILQFVLYICLGKRLPQQLMSDYQPIWIGQYQITTKIFNQKNRKRRSNVRRCKYVCQIAMNKSSALPSYQSAFCRWRCSRRTGERKLYLIDQEVCRKGRGSLRRLKGGLVSTTGASTTAYHQVQQHQIQRVQQHQVQRIDERNK